LISLGAEVAGGEQRARSGGLGERWLRQSNKPRDNGCNPDCDPAMHRFHHAQNPSNLS
jgi:hypothetical protein